jgi:hypothetical protein
MSGHLRNIERCWLMVLKSVANRPTDWRRYNEIIVRALREQRSCTCHVTSDWCEVHDTARSIIQALNAGGDQ